MDKEEYDKIMADIPSNVEETTDVKEWRDSQNKATLVHLSNVARLVNLVSKALVSESEKEDAKLLFEYWLSGVHSFESE